MPYLNGGTFSARLTPQQLVSRPRAVYDPDLELVGHLPTNKHMIKGAVTGKELLSHVFYVECGLKAHFHEKKSYYHDYNKLVYILTNKNNLGYLFVLNKACGLGCFSVS